MNPYMTCGGLVTLQTTPAQELEQGSSAPHEVSPAEPPTLDHCDHNDAKPSYSLELTSSSAAARWVQVCKSSAARNIIERSCEFRFAGWRG